MIVTGPADKQCMYIGKVSENVKQVTIKILNIVRVFAFDAVHHSSLCIARTKFSYGPDGITRVQVQVRLMKNITSRDSFAQLRTKIVTFTKRSFRFFKNYFVEKIPAWMELRARLCKTMHKPHRNITVYYFFVPGCGYSVFTFLLNKALIQLQGEQDLF